MNLLLTIIFIVFIVLLFIGTSYLNAKTKAPDIDLDLSACQGCRSISCNHHPAHQIKDKEVQQ
ncbi:MAG: hypothetical protein ACRCTA_03425 [Bacilli bacterium]